MKNIIIIFCFAFFVANVTIAQIRIDEHGICIGCGRSSDNEIRHKSESTHSKTFFSGVGFIIPVNRSGYFTTLGGSSINLDFGRMHRYQIAPRFDIGRTFQYSYYNYRSWNTANDPYFVDEVIGKVYGKHGIRKQAYRSHNLAAGVFTRYYFVPDEIRLYVDLGVQGDLAYSKFFKIKTYSEGKNKYRNDYAFNTFTASAIARLGWSKKNCWVSVNGKCWWWHDKSRAIFVRYRFTDAFNHRALPMDLPPITIGMQFF